jgi:hypothetical protein
MHDGNPAPEILTDTLWTEPLQSGDRLALATWRLAGVCLAALPGPACFDWKSTGTTLGCGIPWGFFIHSFSQSSSEGTVTSACFEYA